MLYIGNAFSLSMLDRDRQDPDQMFPMPRVPRPITRETARAMLAAEPYRSVVGHESTVSLFTAILDIGIGAHRATLKLQDGDRLIVGQYTGPRLPEGATSLPDGASIEWWVI